MMGHILNKSNRFLPDRDMDLMFEALGRPADISRECYRNDISVAACSDPCGELVFSDNWEFVDLPLSRGVAIFRVSDTGMESLGRYINELDMVNDDPEAE